MNPLEKQTSIDTSKLETMLSGIATPLGNRFYDNSTLDTFRVCPRRFYYRHIRKWETDSIKSALIFGICWHASMDFIWANPTCSVEKAFEIFMKHWNLSELSESEHFDLFPRTPGRALEMLEAYLQRYRNWLINNIEVMAIEKPFIVPLSMEKQNLFYIGKWDKVYKEGKNIYITDHKTSASFATTWLNGWSPNGQVDGYLYAGHMEYGDDFRSVLIDGALVQKTKIDFIKVPVERQAEMLNIWKWEVLDFLDQIFYYEATLLDYRSAKDQKDFLPAYPKCTTSCTSYYGSCPYINLCKFIPNPELLVAPPDGFIESNWRPFEISETPEGTFVVKEVSHD